MHTLIPSAFAQGLTAETVSMLRVPLWAGLFFIVVGTSNALLNNMLVSEGEAIDAFLATAFKRNLPIKKRTWFIILMILLYGIVGAFLNAQFSVLPSVQIGMAIVTILTVIVAGYTKDALRLLIAKKWKSSLWFHANILGLLLAILCVVITRQLHLNPGLIYGLPVGLFVALQSHKDEGRLEFLSLLWMLLLACGIWFLTPIIEPYPVLLDFGNLLFIILIEGAFFELLPLNYLAGGAVFTWHKLLWALLFAGSVFFMFQTFLNPDSTISAIEESPPTLFALILLGCFSAGILILWAYVMLKRSKKETADSRA